MIIIVQLLVITMSIVSIILNAVVIHEILKRSK